MFNLLNLSSDLLNLVFSYLHNTDVQSFKRTNSNYNNLILNNICDCDTKRLDKFNHKLACKNGYLEIVKFIHPNCNIRCEANSYDCAAENGYLNIILFYIFYF